MNDCGKGGDIIPSWRFKYSMCKFITTKVSAISLALLMLAGQAGCTKEESAPPPPPRPAPKPITPIAPATPEATVNRLTNPPAAEVKPHKQEAVTRFPEAMPSLGEKPMATPGVATAPVAPATAPAVAPAEPAAPEAAEPQAAPAPAPEAQASASAAVAPSILAPAKGLTADGTATELKERDWTGVVLVPLDIVSSSAHTVQVLLEHVEAHPLTDGSVRVWLRLRNRLDKPIYTEVGCSFRTHERPDGDTTPFYGLDIAPHGFSDVFFVSPKGRQNLDNYTVLVRSENMLRKTTVKLR